VNNYIRLLLTIVFVVVCAIFVMVCANNPPIANKPAGEWDEMEKAAKNMEKLIFASYPYSKKFVSFLDISIKDGHLIMWINANMHKVNKSTRNEFYRNILDIWRGTKYVMEKHYGSWLEVKYNDYMDGKIGTLKTVK